MSEGLILLASVILLISSFLTRPALLGQNYASISLIIEIIAIFFISFGFTFKLRKRNLSIAVSVLVFWIFLTLHSLLNGNTNYFVIKAFILIITSVFIFAILLSNSRIHDWFFKLFIYFILVQCISYLVTLILTLVAPSAHLILFKFNIQGYAGGGNIYFPLTSVYGTYNIFGREIPRLAAGFRESGITQAYITWAFFSLPLFDLEKPWTKILLVIGLIGTLSTIAIPLFIACYIINWGLAKKISFGRLLFFLFILVIGSYLIYLVSFNLPGIGVKAKEAIPSINARLLQTKNGIEMLINNPIGIGAFNGRKDLTGVNLVAWLGQIGIFGLLLLILMYYRVLQVDSFDHKKIVLILVFLLTWIISQPMYDSVLLYVFFLQETKNSNYINFTARSFQQT